MMTNHRASHRLILAIMAVAFLLAVPLSVALADATITARFGGDGIWPKEATANSQRWIRFRVDWTATGDHPDLIDRVRIAGVTFNDTEAYYDGATSYTYRDELDDADGVWDVSAGSLVSYGVVQNAGGTGTRTLTVGPFAGYHYDWLVGGLPTGRNQPITIYLYWQDWVSNAYVAKSTSVTITHTTVPVSVTGSNFLASYGELQAWHSSEGTGVDPLTVVHSASGGSTNPDNGSGSDEYEFRVKYFSGKNNYPQLPPIWRRTQRPTDGYSTGYARFDAYAYQALTNGQVPTDTDLPHNRKDVWSDSSSDDWMYSTVADPHNDHTGDGLAGSGGMNPEAVLIIDRQYDNPYYMTRESGSDLLNGIVYKYVIRPSNLLQLMRNIFTLAFDPPGDDTWDTTYTGIQGYPTANGYVSMRAGGHTYEFLTSRDTDPPVWSIDETEQDGNKHVGKFSVALRGRPGNALEAIGIVNQDAIVSGNYVHTGVRYTDTMKTHFEDDGPDGYGYPQKSQDFTQYPKVDPVLSAHPWYHGTADPTPGGPLNPTGYAHGPTDYDRYVFSNPETGFPDPFQRYIPVSIGPDLMGAYPNPFNPWGHNTTDPGSHGEAHWPWDRVAGPIDSGVTAGYGGFGDSPRRFTNDDTMYPNYVNIWPDTAATPYQGGKWTTDTNFIFRINYWDADGLAPQYVQLFYRKVDDSGNPIGGGSWMQQTMSKADPSDDTFRDGCVYYYEASGTELGGAGDYQYYFKASDGTGIAIFPNRTSNDPGSLGVAPGNNDYYWFRVNTKPELSGQSVSPASAPIGSDFEYNITYADADGEMDPQFQSGEEARDLGDRPFRTWLHVDYSGDANALTIDTVNPVTEKITYTAAGAAHATSELVNMQVRVAPHYEMNVGNDDSPGNWVIVSNTWTDATHGEITLQSIDDTQPGLDPGDTIRIWLTATMQPDDPNDTNYRDGALYTYNTAQAGIDLAAGVHRYYFEFWDDWATWVDWQQYFMDNSAPDPLNQKVAGQKVRHPEAGFHEGPEVIANTAPHLSRYYFEAPLEDKVASATGSVGTSSLVYVRDPVDLALYDDGDLNGMYLQVASGDAAGYVYEIASNVGDTINLAATAISPATGNPLNDGVSAGNKFRIFVNRVLGADGKYYLSEGFDAPTHGDPVAPDEYEGTAATPFYVYITYTDAENNPPSVIKVRLDGNTSHIYTMEKVNPGDNVYADGVEYRTTVPVYLSSSPTSHYIEAQAYDGIEWYGSPTSHAAYGVTPNANAYFGPLTAPNTITTAANGPDINVNTRPALDFEVGRAEVASASDGSATESPKIVYTNMGIGADAFESDEVVTVQVDTNNNGFDAADPEYRVASHDTGTDTLTLEPGPDSKPVTDGVLAGDDIRVNVALDPASGLETDTYTYWVEYTDTDDYAGVHGNPPQYVSVFIDNVEYAMVEYDPTDTNMVDGKLYYYSTSSLSISENHQYYFMTSDGLNTRRLPETAPAQYDGPVVHVNTAPELTDGAVTPTSGSEEDPPGTPKPYRFEVTYTDADNHAPSEVLLHVLNTSQSGAAWQEFTMQLDPSGDGSYTDGEVFFVEAYAFKTGDNQIGDGHHEFYFSAEDIHGLSARDPADPDVYSGPTINDAPDAPSEGFSPASPDYPATAPATNDPADLTVIDDATPQISWTAADELDPNATDTADTLHYVVTIATDKQFTTVVQTLTSNDGEAFVTVPDTSPLNNKTAYYYNVVTVDDDGLQSAPSYAGGDPYDAVTAFYVNTNHAPYWDSPTSDQFTPTGQVTTLTPTLEWPDGADDDVANPVSSLRYRVEIDDNSDFNDPEYASPLQGAGVTSLTVPSGHLTYGITYYWRVQVSDGDANSLWTNELSPQILPSFSTVENARPIAPADGFSPALDVDNGESQTQRPTFDFADGSDPDATDPVSTLRYEVELDTDNDWTDGVNLLNDGDKISDPGDSRVVMTTLSAPLGPDAVDVDDLRYYWRVRTLDDQDEPSNWSPTQTFWLNTQNEKPRPPADGFLPQPPSGSTEVWLPDPPGNAGIDPLMWDPSEDPDHSDDPDYFADQLRYTVQLSTDPDFASIPYELTTAFGVTEVAVPDDLTRGVEWYWRVLAEDDEAAVSDASHAGGAADPAPSFWINQNPTLANGSVEPVVAGDIGENDQFRFEVTYTDLDNHAPDSIEVIVTPQTPTTGTPLRFAMQVQGAGPHDYTTGEVFEAVVTGIEIGDGDHTFYFEASDGVQQSPTQLYDPSEPANTEFTGPTVNDAPNPVDSGFDPADADPPVVIDTRVPTISWDAAVDPNSTDTAATLTYRVEFSNTGSGDPAGFVVEGAYTRTTAAGTTSATPLAALPEGFWFYRIITIDDDAAESTPSAEQQFQVRLNHAPDAPTPIGEYLPTNGSTITDPTPLLQWPDGTDQDASDTADTLAYDVQLDDNMTFSSPIVNLRTPQGQSEHQVGATLAIGVTYYWRVRTVDDSGDTSEWSTDALGLTEPMRFQVGTNSSPQAPTAGFNPTDGMEVGTVRPTLSWDDATDPDASDTPDTLHYEVQLDDNDDWSDANIFAPPTAVSADGISEISLTLDLTENGHFWWRVRTIDSQGLASAWSADQHFYVNQINDNPLAPDSGFSPAGGVTTSQQLVTLQWDAADDPDPSDDATNLTYLLELDTDTDFSDAPYSLTSNVGQPSAQVTAALAQDHWYWRVRARDDEGALSPWSAVQDFVVAGNNNPNEPSTGFDPTNGNPVFSLRPTLDWDDATDPDPSDTPATLHYEVQLDDNNDWSDANLWAAGANAGATSAAGVSQVTLDTDLTENTEYWYRVRTVDDEGAESDWSPGHMFWVNSENQNPTAPSSGFSPNNGQDTELQRPPLNWNAASDPDNPSPASRQTDTPGTLTYIVQLSTDDTFGSVNYQYSTAAPGQTQLIPGDDLTDLTTWYWRVRAVDDEGARSPWSLIQYFDVDTNNQPPVLSNGGVTPLMGDLATTFEFRVVYTDAENDPPIGDIMVHAGANSIDLVMQRDPNDNDEFSEGVTYLATVRGDDPGLGLGGYNHYYYIDGTTVRYPAAPNTLVGPVVAAEGTIRITDSSWADADAFEEGDTVYVEVTDADENQDPAAPDTVDVTVTSANGDSETVTLTETGAGTGVFRGDIDMLGAAGAADDGELNVISGASGRQITATWADPDEVAAGGAAVSDQARVTDTIAPNAVAADELTVTSADEGLSAVINWQGYDEAAQPNNQPDVASYHVWQSETDFNDSADATLIGTVAAGTQTFDATGLSIGTEYFFAVTVADEVPNETTAVVTKSVLTEDTRPPQLENWQYDAEGGTLSFDLTDRSGVDMDTLALRIDGTDYSGDAVWDDTDITHVTVDYTAPDGWGYNRQVDFAVDVSDIYGNAMATYTAQEDAPTDDTNPTADQLTPADGATNVPVGTEISARLRDTESGVDTDTVVMTLNGVDVSDDVVPAATAAAAGQAEVVISYQPDEPLDYSTEYTVHLEFADAVGNTETEEWSFTTVDEPKFEIRGLITDTNGDPMAGVSVTAAGQTVSTDGNGAYRVLDLSAGTYTVTPSMDEYDFDPASREVTVGPDARDINFTGELRTYSISGRITRDGSGAAGVTVTDGTRTATTDENGDYTINGVPSGSYTVTPSRDADEDGMEDFNYTPGSRTVDVDGAPVTGVNFTATLVTYSISGTISDSRGNRISGVSVSDGTRTAITNEAGQFTISGVPPSTVTLTPTKAGIAFDPETIDVTVPPDSTGNNFVAYTEFRQRFQSGVHMVGVPATPPSSRDRAVDIFRTDQVARWDAQRTPPGYISGEDTPDALQLEVRPGVGFFVNFAGVTDVVVPGDPVDETSSFSVGVAPGWNQVGNMYQTALPLANISGAGSTQVRPFAFIWDNEAGSYRMISPQPAFNSARTYIEAWEAAWFKATGVAGTLNITAPANVASAALIEGAAARVDAPDEGWLVDIVARVANRADVTTVAGVGSGDESHGYMVENPPMMPGSVDVYFTNDSGVRLAHDVRPQTSGPMVWPFAVETDIANAEVEITLPDLSGVPNDMAAYLTDMDSGKRMYARTLPAYTFTTGADGALRHFELEVAPRGADNLTIRSASVQAGNGGLMVTYDVSTAANVSIEVLNIAGRSVRKLIESRAVSAGSNEQMWDARSTDGTLVPNGSYLIKIEAVAENGQRVQALRPAQIAR